MTKIILKTVPPSVNRSYKQAGGHFYKSSEAKVAQESMAWEARKQWKGKPLVGPVSLEVDFYWPNMRRDIDSGLKSLLDALSGICYGDDRQIEELVVHKHSDKEKPRAEIVVLSLV